MPKSEDMPRGLDVASWQGVPAWDKVAAAGYSFSFTKCTESITYVNPTFAANWIEIKAVGMARGAYHFARPDSNAPEDEAEYFVAHVAAHGLEQGDLLALDLEAGEGDLSDWALNWLQRVERLVGFRPLIYASPSFILEHNLARRPELGQYGLWLASWRATMPIAPAPWSLIAFWQDADDAVVPGIAGHVDHDKFNGPVERIRLYGKPAGQPAPAPPPSSSYTYRSDFPVQYQIQDYTCSIRATQMALSSIGIEVDAADLFDLMVPTLVNSDVGLRDGSGAGIAQLLRDHWGLDAHSGGLSFDDALARAGKQPLAIGGHGWGRDIAGRPIGHWVAVRRAERDRLILGNSAGHPPMTDPEGLLTTYMQQFLDRGMFDARGNFHGFWIDLGAAPSPPADDRLAGLISAVGYLGADVADRVAALEVRKSATEKRDTIVTEMRRVRDEQLGPRPPR